MKKIAFTLAEILICIVIIGFLAVIMLASYNIKSFEYKTYLAEAYRIVDAVDLASAQIRERETEKVSMGAFLFESGSSWKYANFDVNTSTAVFDLYKQNLKLISPANLNFCNHTGYTSCPTDVVGGQLQSKAYIGFKLVVNNNTKAPVNCPQYYDFETLVEALELYSKTNRDSDFVIANYKKSQTASAFTNAKQCWANVYVDVNGTKGPNKEGVDVYIFGIDDVGIAK